MNYLKYFQLEQEPFSNAPVTRFYYNSSQHARAMSRLMFAVENMRGLAVCVGNIGAGKTTLARRMLDNLPEDQYEAALLVIIHSGITASWLLKRIALQLGVPSPAEDKLALLSQLYQRLVEIYEQGRKAVVLIDEAQMLQSRELMEEFRGLTNLEVPERKLLTFVFFGLPELEKNLLLDPPLAQRVAVKYRLEPLSMESVEAYIKHRLRTAGARKMLFTSQAVEGIYTYSKGVPRLVNTICDNSLFEAAMARKVVVNRAIVDMVARTLGLDHIAPGIDEPPLEAAAAAGGVASPAVKPPAPVSMEEIDRYLDALTKG